MNFCPNCGKELPNSVKFCPYCGDELVKENDEIAKEKSKMSKGVTKSLQDSNNLENIAQKAKENFSKTSSFNDSSKEEIIEKRKKYLLPNKTIGLYFILSLILQAGDLVGDEVMGIFIYTWIVLIVIFLRGEKERPFNWLLNIIIFLQAILVFSVGMTRLDYMGAISDSLGVIIELGILTLLFITILLLLYQGNRSKQ